MMKALLPLALAATFALTAPVHAAAPALNQLTAAEQAAGWRLLFNGTSLDGWRGYRKPQAPTTGWQVKDGILTCAPGGKGGDIITRDQFDDFELSWEWSMPAKSNNGVKYFITEANPSAIGHEYQMIDDSLIHGDDKSSTSSFYLVVAPNERKKVKPFGEWNHSRIIVLGNHVEHWLNGEKVVEYELGSPAILQQVAKTKFKSAPGFGTKVRGHILLTYHNDECSFRNVKVRELKSAK
jgi:hypothetical protein